MRALKRNSTFVTILLLLGIYVSAQTSWTPSNSGLPNGCYVNGITETTTGDLFVIENLNGQSQLFKSANNGSSWLSVPQSGLPSGGWAGSIFAKGNTLFIGSSGLGSGLYNSTNNGLNWTPSNTGLPNGCYVNGIAAVSNGDLFVIENLNGQAQLFKSTNNGSSWLSVAQSGLPSGSWAGSFFANNNTLFIGSNGLGSCLYRSTDNGLNWAPSNSGLPNGCYVNGITAVSNGDLYVIENMNGQAQLFKSTNNGSSWSSVAQSGLPSGGWAGSFFANSNTLFIGSGGLGSSLYRSSLATSKEEYFEIADIKIYPNPVNNILTIENNLKKAYLEIVDMNGSSVYSQLLINTSTEINVSTLSNGMYTIRLFDENKIIKNAKRVIVLNEIK